MIMALIGVLALVFLLFWLMKKLNKRVTVSDSRHMKVLERINLGQDKMLLLVSVCGQCMVIGVTNGFEKKLVMQGVGYKAEKKGKNLVMQLGYSHPIEMEDPEGITTEVTSPTEILVKGIDKAFVGNYAAIIREKRLPEPYKGKGIRYADEVIRRKEGKAGAKK